MKRQAILAGIGYPERIVQEIRPHPRTITVCPVCKKRFKKNDLTVLVDLITCIRLPTGKNKQHGNEPEHTVRIHLCEPCAQPVIQERKKAMDGFIKFLAELTVEQWRQEQGEKTK